MIERLLAERAASGETYRSLEERSGIAAATLAWWQKKLRDEAEDTPGLDLVEVGWANLSGSSTTSVEVVLPFDVVIRVPVGSSPEVLGQVLDQVFERC